MTVRVVERPARTLAVQIYFIEVWKGLGVTFRHFFVNMFRQSS